MSCCRRRRPRLLLVITVVAVIVLILMLLILDLVHVINCTRIPSAGHSILPNGRQHHSLSQTLLEPTRLAPVSLLFRNDTIVFRDTSVNALILNSSLEETLTALAGDYSIV